MKTITLLLLVLSLSGCAGSSGSSSAGVETLYSSFAGDLSMFQFKPDNTFEHHIFYYQGVRDKVSGTWVQSGSKKVLTVVERNCDLYSVENFNIISIDSANKIDLVTTVNSVPANDTGDASPTFISINNIKADFNTYTLRVKPCVSSF